MASNEQRYFDALKRITAYMKPEQLRKSCQKMYGLDYEEALEYAYENVLSEAASVVRGKRRPKEATASTRPALRPDGRSASNVSEGGSLPLDSGRAGEGAER